MKYIRKSTAIILILAIFLVFSFSTVFPEKAYAQDNIIHETSKTQILTSGATLETKTRFTDNGWLKINIVRVDLTNPNIAVDALINNPDINLATVQNLAQSSGAIAAVNANFFIWEPDRSKGRPIGPVIQSGQVVTEDTGINTKTDKSGSKVQTDEYGTFSIDNLNQCLIDFWNVSIRLTAPNGNSVEVGRYNQPYHGHTDFSIIDSRMRKTTIGTTSGSADTVEMLVANGKVVEIRQKMPETNMPENGYIVVTRTEGSKFLLDNFKVGDDVSVTFSSKPDWSDKKMAVSGAAILLKNGAIPAKFSQIASSGDDPRTAIGSSKDGQHLFLVTVDGRSSKSIGMTQTELAQFMMEIGAYNALNFDGGGSTVMAARPEGSASVSVVNSPSEYPPRKVSTAIGVFSIAPKSELKGLRIENNDGNIFINTSRAYNVTGYDTFFNPVDVDPASVKWSVSGIKGTFEGNVFHPASIGTGKIKATVGNISQETTVYCLSAPVQLSLSDNALNLAAGKTKAIYVTGKNSSGYYTTISPGDVKWTVSSDFGSFSNGVFKAEKYGAGYIDAQIGNVHAYCKVTVKDDGQTVKDTFESDNGTIMPDPATVTASYQISNEQAHAGSFSGKLTYDFPNSHDKRTAYIVFKNNGIPLSSNTTKLGIWAYNDHANSNCLGVQVCDASGKSYSVDFTNGMDWTGWKYLEASLKDIKSPSKVERLYLSQSNPVPDTGCLYLDSLSTITSGGNPTLSTVSMPKDTEPVDEANKYVPFKKSPASFRFAVFGQSSEPKNSLQKLLLSKFTYKINSLLDFSAVVGKSSHAFAAGIKKPKLATGSGYKTIDYQNSRFIQLDMSKGSLRKTNPAQWHWFLSQLNSASGNNVFIMLANSPQNFSDSLEADLFQDILTQYKLRTKKNVWVFYNGSKNTGYMEKGIKYVSSAGFDVSGLKPESTDVVQYALVTVNGNSVTYQFRPVTP